ncbi:MAG: hypothetical protein EOP06_07575 [Proteobacteria bacterium]|nr:MAG: hypothetical protein EOP06_07575 [Pseudomonadota bacterium]
MWALVNAAWFGLLIGTVLGIAGLWFGVYSYRQSRQITRLRSMEGHTALMGPSPVEAEDRLRILFDNVDVPRLTSSSFGFWNDGTTTIRGDDIVKLDPLVIRVNGGSILRATMEAATRPQIDVHVREADDHVFFTFDYLDPGDGFKIQLLHSGKLDAASLSGSVRGLPRGVEPFDRNATAAKWAIGLLGFLAILLLACIAGGFVWVAYMVYSTPWPSNLPILGFLFVMIGSVVMMIFGKSSEAIPVRRIKGVPDIVSSDMSLR